MKKVLAMILAGIMICSMSIGVIAAPDASELDKSFGIDKDEFYEQLSVVASLAKGFLVSKSEDRDYGSNLKEYVITSDDLSDMHIIYDENNEVCGLLTGYLSDDTDENASYKMGQAFGCLYTTLVAVQEGGITSQGFADKADGILQEDIGKIEEILGGDNAIKLLSGPVDVELSSAIMRASMSLEGSSYSIDMWLVPLE